MGLPVKARHLPPRIAAGAFIINAGAGKWSATRRPLPGCTGSRPARTRS